MKNCFQCYNGNISIAYIVQFTMSLLYSIYLFFTLAIDNVSGCIDAKQLKLNIKIQQKLNSTLCPKKFQHLVVN